SLSLLEVAMSATSMRPAEWLAVARQEYLQNLIRGGGREAKFIAPPEGINPGGLKQGLRRMAEAEGYQFVWVDAATTRVHMIDHWFHEIAQQIDWDDLPFSFVARLLAAQGPPHSEET